MNIRPTRRLLFCLALLCLAALAAAVLSHLWPAWRGAADAVVAGLMAALLCLAAWDARRRPFSGSLRLERILPAQLVQGQAQEVTLCLTPPDGRYWQRPRQLLICDLHPADWHGDDAVLPLTVLPGRSSRIAYRATPMRRGEAAFAGVECWLPSPWGWWLRRQRLPLAEQVKVLPDFSRILGAELVSMQRWLDWVGVKKLPRFGQGQDFYQLRDYHDGDDIRRIDWKASARAGKPIVRSYQQEQDQQVIFLLDCGRSMRLYMDGLSHFDHSLQAMLLLSFTALKHGDAVGLLTFAHARPRAVPPHKGLAQLGRLVQGVYDIEPSLQAGDLEAAVNLLLQRQRRRALVVVLTHFNHDDVPQQLTQLKRLQRHHVVLLAGLRPQAPEALLTEAVTDNEHAAAYLGAWHYRHAGEQVLRQLQAHRIHCLSALPSELSSGLINRYLQLKRRRAW